MDFRTLEYFVAVAEESHFTRAATRMHVSQSGLSAAIKTLEVELHATLFERTTRRVQLTAAGAALLPEARRALAAVRAGADAVEGVHGLQRGHLSVGVMQQMGVVELPRILARYHRLYPGIKLRLRQASADALHQLLIDGDLDLAVASPPVPVDARLIAVDLLRTPIVLACRGDDPYAARKAISIRDLAGRNLIGFPQGWALRNVTDRAAAAAGVSMDVNLEVNDTATLLDLVEAGVGVTLIAEALARQRRSLRTVPLSATMKSNWTVSALSVAPAPTNPAASALWQLLVRRYLPSRRVPTSTDRVDTG
jgi:DNA-binding transcriptional LysR family regulator